MESSPPTRTIRLEIDPAGRGTVTLDGLDVSAQVAAVDFRCGGSVPLPMLTLYPVPGCTEIAGQAVVRIVDPDAEVPLTDWLAAQDVDALRERVLAELEPREDAVAGTVRLLRRLAAGST